MAKINSNLSEEERALAIMAYLQLDVRGLPRRCFNCKTEVTLETVVFSWSSFTGGGQEQEIEVLDQICPKCSTLVGWVSIRLLREYAAQITQSHRATEEGDSHAKETR